MCVYIIFIRFSQKAQTTTPVYKVRSLPVIVYHFLGQFTCKSVVRREWVLLSFDSQKLSLISVQMNADIVVFYILFEYIFLCDIGTL